MHNIVGRAFARPDVTCWECTLSMAAAFESVNGVCSRCAYSAPAPLNPWIWSSKPWKRIHIDFAGPLYSRLYLIIMDAHSKCPEVMEISTTTFSRTIVVYMAPVSFYSCGLPEQVVSDNGSQFVSDKFQQFMCTNGVKHIRCAPYHPPLLGQPSGSWGLSRSLWKLSTMKVKQPSTPWQISS